MNCYVSGILNPRLISCYLQGTHLFTFSVLWGEDYDIWGYPNMWATSEWISVCHLSFICRPSSVHCIHLQSCFYYFLQTVMTEQENKRGHWLQTNWKELWEQLAMKCYDMYVRGTQIPVVRATKFCTMAPNICGFSERNIALCRPSGV